MKKPPKSNFKVVEGDASYHSRLLEREERSIALKVTPDKQGKSK
eukprot:CAMPEP_0176453556 /NCGR_PEP_ID=MMETSP0127-20121128/29306_1 /TAXON_ID=938130 /ORGANISM="Platyophrya macrostoma, Strain WH" /LENGTH=43 /DNA_ID= /DNA_START= /DNA_END= /DNA_ORIENTATION=